MNKNSSPSDFVQYSIDLRDFKIISKKCELLKQPDLHFLMKTKKILGEFYKELTELFQNKINYNNQYYLILNY